MEKERMIFGKYPESQVRLLEKRARKCKKQVGDTETMEMLKAELAKTDIPVDDQAKLLLIVKGA